MVEQLSQEAERETWLASRERKYLRLVAGKVILVFEAEVMEEVVLAKPRVLTDQDIIVCEWDDRVKKAEQLKELISLVHKMMRADERRPSRYQADYDALWDEYRDAITDLRELDAETIDEFRDKVATRAKELEVKLNTMCDNWNPNDFDDFEQTLACYERNYDLMMALGREN